MLTILLIILVIVALGGMPVWPYSRDRWSWGPSGLLLVLIIVLLVLLLEGVH
jgi:hypothetical protein